MPSKKLTNVERIVDHILEHCDSSAVTFWTWTELTNAVHGDTLGTPPRYSKEAGKDMSNHFSLVKEKMQEHKWDVRTISFVPFRKGYAVSGGIVPADMFDRDELLGFLPSSHNRAVGLAIIGAQCGSHPIVGLALERRVNDCITRKNNTASEVNAAMDRGHLPQAMSQLLNGRLTPEGIRQITTVELID